MAVEVTPGAVPDCGVALGGRRSSIRPGQGPRGPSRSRLFPATVVLLPACIPSLVGSVDARGQGPTSLRCIRATTDTVAVPLRVSGALYPIYLGFFPSERLIRGRECRWAVLESGVRDAMVLVRLAERAAPHRQLAGRPWQDGRRTRGAPSAPRVRHRPSAAPPRGRGEQHAAEDALCAPPTRAHHGEAVLAGCFDLEAGQELPEGMVGRRGSAGRVPPQPQPRHAV